MTGPSYCASCGEWPASKSDYGQLCHLCYCRKVCEANPVPLPRSAEALRDLAAAGYLEPSKIQEALGLANAMDKYREANYPAPPDAA